MTKSSKTIKEISNAAIITAFYIVFLLVSRFFVPDLEEMLFFILPIPAAIYSYKYNFKSSLLLVFASGFISFFIINPFNALFYIVPALILGSIYGVITKNNWKTWQKIALASVFSLVVEVLTSVVFAKLFDYNIVEDFSSVVHSLVQFLESLNLSYVSETLLTSIIVGLIPSILIIIALLQGILICLLSTIIMTKLHLIEKKSVLSIKIITLPKFVSFIYLTMLIVGIIILPNYSKENTFLYVLESIEINLTVVYSLFMIFLAILYVADYSRIKNKMWLYYLACLSIFVFPFVMVVIGILDNLLRLHYHLLCSSVNPKNS